MLEDFLLQVTSDRLQEIARMTDREAAEEHRARFELALTRGATPSPDGRPGDAELTLLVAYLRHLRFDDVNDMPAESHAALLERLAAHPAVLSPAWREQYAGRLAPAQREVIVEIGEGSLDRLFVDLDDAVVRYLCVSTAVVYDGLTASRAWDFGHPEHSAVGRIARRAAERIDPESLANVGARLLGELTEVLLDLWVDPAVRPSAETAIRDVLGVERERRGSSDVVQAALLRQADLVGGQEAQQLRALL